MADRKHNFWRLITVLLLVVCLIQGAVLFKFLRPDVFKRQPSGDVDAFSSFLNDKFRQEQKGSRDLFDRFFSDEFFTQKTDPFEEMEQMRRQMEKLMDNTVQNRFRDSWGGWFDDRFFGASSQITIDQEETGDSYVYTVTIPNLAENNIDIAIDGNGIVLSGEFSQAVERKDGNGHIIGKSEMRQCMSRTLSVPVDADIEKARIDNRKEKIIITLPKS